MQLSLERNDQTLTEFLEWAIKEKVRNGKYPSKSDFSVMYNNRWVSLSELVEYARKRGIEV